MLKNLTLRCTLIAFAWTASLPAYAYADETMRLSAPGTDLTYGVDWTGAVPIAMPVPVSLVRGPILATNEAALPTVSAPTSERQTTGAESRASSGHQVRLVDADDAAVRENRSAASQNASPVVSQETVAASLDEVVVTAQRRLQDLQRVPIAVQVIGGQILAEQNHTTLEELSQTVPSVHVGTGGLSSDLYIRGVGSGENPGFDQSVATFVDDIYHGKSRLSGATFLDLERIEILKGPQSTFFGDNAIAGALNIVTKKPGGQFEGSGRALYGMFGQYAVEGAAGGPLTDALGVRLAVTRSGESGWIKNVNTGRDAPVQNNLAGRLTVVYKPIEDLDATLKVEGSRHRTSGTPFDYPLQFNCPPPAPFPPTFTAGAPIGSCVQASTLGVPIGLNQNKNSDLAGQGNSLSTFEDVLTINYRNWGHTFTSVSGYYNYHFNTTISATGIPVYFNTNQYPEHYHQFSQELRVASPTEQPVQYLAGAYFQTDELGWHQDANFPFLNAVLGGIPPLVPYLPLGATQDFSQPEKVYSVFGSLTWNVTDRLKLNGGIRGSRVEKDTAGDTILGSATQNYGGIVPLPPALQAALSGAIPNGIGPSLSRSDRSWMPSAGVQYQMTPDAMAYFSYSRGFLAGGFNALNPLGTNDTKEYGPEHVNAYELGIKSKWLEDRLRLNLDVFRSNYQGLQVSAFVFNPALGISTFEVKNAAESRSQGVEFEGEWVATRDFRFKTNVTYLDSHYVSYLAGTTTLQNFCSADLATYNANSQCSAFPFPVPPFHNAAGERTPFSPRWSGSVTASYSTLFSNTFRFTAELSPYLTSTYYTNAANGNDSFFHVGGYVRLDGRLSLETPDQRWALDLIGKNLTDRVIVVTAGILESKEQPRNVAIQVRYRFP